MTHTPSRARVRLVLVGALAALTLTACGQSQGNEADDTASEPTAGAPSSDSDESGGTTSDGPSDGTSPAPGDSASATGGEGDTSTGGGAGLPAGDAASTTSARIVSVSNADGDVTPVAVPLDDPASLRRFVAPFGADLGPRVRAAVRDTEVPPGQRLMGAVVAVGCDEPTGIELTETFDGYEVRGIVPKSGVQCLVAVTSVALFLVETP
jgi:hypothetical protein